MEHLGEPKRAHAYFIIKESSHIHKLRINHTFEKKKLWKHHILHLIIMNMETASD